MAKQKRYLIYNPVTQNNDYHWYMNKVDSLRSQGYVEMPNGNGGDNDFIVVDTLRKEWIFWENGFYPFCYDEEYLRKNPVGHNLTYWMKHRH